MGPIGRDNVGCPKLHFQMTCETTEINMPSTEPHFLQVGDARQQFHLIYQARRCPSKPLADAQ